MHRQLIRILFVLPLIATVCSADDFPELYNNDSERDAVPMQAAESAVGMEVPDGFQVQVFAQEPEVQNPIAMTWDGRGRFWIAENFTYAQRAMRFDLSLRDRVLVLEDTDRDGVADKRTVFSDNVQMLTSLEVGHGGVWLMCPPQLLFIPDADGDDVPDQPAKVVLDGFDVAAENYHNFANGLKWGPDGWLYGRCGGSCPGRVGLPGTADEQRVPLEGGIWRYHPATEIFEVLSHGTTNPWGHDWNSLGEAFFINTVNGHLWHMIPGAHFMRPFTLDPNPHVYELIDMHADHWHFDTGKGWNNTRDTSGSFGGGHAHTGMMIYLGDNWPDQYRDRLFTLNMHGRRANQELLEREGSGYVASHGADLLQSPDTFFRGIDLSYGPDGAVYVIDWSDTGECHEHTGVHRTSGRVFRVSNDDAQAKILQQQPDLRKSSNQQLTELLNHGNEWYVRQARSILAERALAGKDLSATQDALRHSVSNDETVSAYRSLLTLHAIGGTDKELLQQLLGHANEHIRVWAVRLLTDLWPIDDVHGPNVLSKQHAERVAHEAGWQIERFCGLARTDSSAMVRLALASTLQRLPLEMRPQLAAALMSRSEDTDDHNLPLMVWYGLMAAANDDTGNIAGLVADCKWPKTQRFIARRVGEDIEKNPTAVSTVLDAVIKSSQAAEQENIMLGLADGLRGWRKAEQPANWEAVTRVTSEAKSEKLQQITRDLSVLFGDGRALDEVRKIVLDNSAEIGLRQSALKSLVNAGGDELRDICLPLLKDARLNVIAASGLSRFNDPKIASELIASYRRFRAPQRPKVIATLVSRPGYAKVLLAAIKEGRIPSDALSAFDVRQIRSLDTPELTEQVAALWGEINESPEERRQQIESLHAALDVETLASADPSQGRQLFQQTCAKCHRLFGEGDNIGPDLTGANRNNMDYLLENIVDPSAVVSKDFLMSIVTLHDGRVLNGLIVSRNEKTITLQTQNDRQTVSLDEVDDIEATTLSPMPNGLLDNLTPQQVKELFAYLQQPAQVPLPE